MINMRINRSPATMLLAILSRRKGNKTVPASASNSKNRVDRARYQLLLLISFANGFVANIRSLPLSIGLLILKGLKVREKITFFYVSIGDVSITRIPDGPRYPFPISWYELLLFLLPQ